MGKLFMVGGDFLFGQPPSTGGEKNLLMLAKHC